jgi:hypothetical protein
MTKHDIWTWRQERADKARRRRQRRIWLTVIVIGMALLIALALTERAGASCAPYQAAGRVTNVSRVIHPLPWPVRYYVAGYTFGHPTWFFGTTTRTAYRVGETVLVKGCPNTKQQLTGVTLSRP